MKMKKNIMTGLLVFAMMIGLISNVSAMAKSKASEPTLSKKKITLYKGKTSVLKVKKASKKVKWSMSNKKTVKLSAKKKFSVKITAKKAGTVKIFAKVNKKKLVCKVTVRNKRVVATTKPSVKPSVKPTQTATPTATPTITPTVSPTENPTDKRTQDIVILYENDVHCAVDDNIGFAGMALYKKQMMKETPYVSLVDAGDVIQGAPLGTLTKGSALVDIMNEMEYDFAIPGNHEFDYGMEQFLTLNERLSGGYYSCNFLSTKTGNTVLKPYRMIEYGDTSVAYVGVTTPESFTKSTPKYFQDEDGNYIYSFCEDETGEALYNQIQKNVDEVKKAGADYVVLVGHLGESSITEKWTSDSILKNTSGIDVCIDGHSHESVAGKKVQNKEGKEVIITQTGTKFSSIGKMTIDSKGAIRTELLEKIPESSDALILDDGRAVDKTIKEYIDGKKADFNELLSTEIGKTDFLLTDSDADGNRAVRSAETNLGDLTADAYRTAMDADIGLSNGGGIRAAIKSGVITYNDALSVFPFGNSICMVEATGQQIMDCLEMGARNYPEENGSFMQVSGMTYTIDSTIPSSVTRDVQGNFVSVDGEYRVKDVKINGEDIDLTKVYTVASHNYLLKSCGDGMSMFENATLVKDEVITDVDALVNYISSFTDGIPEGYRDIAGQGRISIAKAAAEVAAEVQVAA